MLVAIPCGSRGLPGERSKTVRDNPERARLEKCAPAQDLRLEYLEGISRNFSERSSLTDPGRIGAHWRACGEHRAGAGSGGNPAGGRSPAGRAAGVTVRLAPDRSPPSSQLTGRVGSELLDSRRRRSPRCWPGGGAASRRTELAFRLGKRVYRPLSSCKFR
jgi:hypothetical protein